MIRYIVNFTIIIGLTLLVQAIGEAFFKKKKKYKSLAQYALDGKQILNERPEGMPYEEYKELRREQTKVLKNLFHGNHHKLYRNEAIQYDHESGKNKTNHLTTNRNEQLHTSPKKHKT